MYMSTRNQNLDTEEESARDVIYNMVSMVTTAV